MAAPTALFRFRIELADIDRELYTPLDFRVAQHPSETLSYLLSRVLAFALNAQDGLKFSSGGLSDPDEPCISAESTRGGLKLWIEVGNSTPRKLHKAAKAAETVKVYTYKNADHLVSELISEGVHRASAIEVYSFSNGFLDDLALWLKRENRWSLTHTDGSLTIADGEKSLQCELRRHPVISA